MTLRRYGNTNYQENKLAVIEKLAKKLNFSLRYGTSIGKSPQSVILDHKYQDGIIHVSSSSSYGISFNGEDNVSLPKLKDLMVAQLKNESNPASSLGGVFG